MELGHEYIGSKIREWMLVIDNKSSLWPMWAALQPAAACVLLSVFTVLLSENVEAIAPVGHPHQ